MKKIYLYAFDRAANVVNTRFLLQDEFDISSLRIAARQMYLLAGKEPIVVYAIDNRPGLAGTYFESAKSNDPAAKYALYDLVERYGLYIHN